MDFAVSKNGVPIRLPLERWLHITVGHPEVADYYFEIFDTIEEPNVIFEGARGELLAVKRLDEQKLMVVVYREVHRTDGFVITAFLTKRLSWLQKRRQIWP